MSNNNYNNLISLWTAGRREYHRLTATYVTANSLLIASLSFLSKDSESISNNASSIFIISIIGIFLCYNMKIAQSKLSGENYYWERSLRIIERKEKKEFFLNLHKLMNKKNFKLKEEGEKAMFRNLGMIRHKKWYARRMKLYPTIFGWIYGLFILQLSTIPMILDNEKPQLLRIGSGLFFLCLVAIIWYILQPERSEIIKTWLEKTDSHSKIGKLKPINDSEIKEINDLHNITFRLNTAFFGTLIGFTLSFLRNDEIINPANPLWWKESLNIQVALFRLILIGFFSVVYLAYWYFFTKKGHWQEKRYDILQRGWWGFLGLTILDFILAFLPYLGYFIGETYQQVIFPQ